MNPICELFGYKIITAVHDNGGFFSDVSYRQRLTESICKRCDLTVKQIQKYKLSKR